MPARSRKSSNPASRARPFGLVLVGAGLLSLGVVALVLIPKPQLASPAQARSVIPVKVNFPAPDLELTDLQGNPALPNSYVIDAEGSAVLGWSGAIDREALEKYVTPLLEDGS